MSEIKSTPGPWRTTPNGVVTSDSCQIAHVGETSRPADMVGSFERWDADARLIAAAPDLLDACRQFSRALESEDEYELGNAYQSAGMAIAKATGEES